MLKIEFIEYKNESRQSFRIKVNSKIDEDSFWSTGKIYEGRGIYNVGRFYDDEVIDDLISYSFEEVGNFLHEVAYNNYLLENWDFGVETRIICKNYNSTYAPEIQIILEFGFEEWNKPYSFLKFSEIFKQIIETEEYRDFYYFEQDEENIANGFGIGYAVKDVKATIISEEERVIEFLEIIIKNTEKELIANLDKDLITSYFTFPEGIKAACKQYLVYFAQFLMDLGIEADTEIKEVAHQTLFKVIPKNKEESLDKIREALDVYLNIPKDFDIQVAQNNDVAVLQWQANVMHLKSQIMLAQSAIQLKDATINSQIATIESLKLSNYQYREILEQKNLESEAKNEVEIAGGLVKVKEYDGDGFSINLPEILRRLKRIFK